MPRARLELLYLIVLGDLWRAERRNVQIWDDGARALESCSSLADKSPSPCHGPVVKVAELHPEQKVQENNSTRGPQASVSAALSAARAGESARTAGVRFPAEDGGRSLAEMAQRDLDAALQLLADRAQYITGASGAAIALRRSGKNDMLCRASAGENAPELGALLSTEFGLSGESVRTRQPLRCDDAERDARVNRDVCRQMGIASVVVMPVVNDDEVLGVFELFSGKANAFGVRDVSAVQRLSEMVETAVRLAQATESLPERLKMQQASPALANDADVLEDQDLAGQVLEDTVLEDRVLEESVLEKPAPTVRVATEKKPQDAGSPVTKVGARAEKPHVEVKVPAPSPESGQVLGQKAIARQASTVEKTAAPRKPLFWSAALSPAADTGKTEETDQSHVPPVLRSLRKCDACGFPVSAGRALCVECEEKKWRGQLKVSKAGPTPAVASSPAIAVAFAAAAPTAGAGAVAPPSDAGTASVAISPAIKERKEGAEPVAAAPVLGTTVVETAAKPVVPETSTGAFVLSAGLEPSQSWIARNKYVLGALLVIGVAAAAVFLLR